MILRDHLRLALGALREHRLRTALSVLGIGIGVATVVLLTSIGEGTRRYIVSEFTQFGTNILQINPGKTETFGIPGALGGTTRKLTIDDAEVLRRVAGVEEVIPVVMGQGRVEGDGKGRSVYILGATSAAPDLWQMDVRQGRFLPPGDPRRGGPFAVLGAKLKTELFGETQAIGRWVRIAGRRLRVIGVMERKGQILGFDMDDLAFVPVATAMRLFNMDELMEIDVTFAHERLTDRVEEGIRRVLTERHGGHEDFTILTQAAMLDTFNDIMRMITIALGAIAAISLIVGSIGVLTMMWISVGERTHEIGLIRAVGGTAAQVQRLFLLEAIGLATLGGLFGLVSSSVLIGLVRLLAPALPVQIPLDYAVIALLVSGATGLLSGVLPARRAAELDPIEALHAE